MSALREILALLDEYFVGLYSGDVARLRAVFRSDAVLFGQVKNQPYHERLGDYLNVVRDRQSPEARGEPFAMRVVALEAQGAIAHAVVRCPMLGFNYLDHLSLVRDDGKWAIASKVFTHLESE